MKVNLIDTAILVDFLRGKSDALTWIHSLDVLHTALSVVTVAELIRGCRNKSELDSLNKELGRYTEYHFNAAISERALDWYQRFHLSHGVGYLDCLIAATAVEYESQVCTLSVKYFEPLPGVDVRKPY